MEGWQCWELVTTYCHQVRTAGMGAIIGFDVPALLEISDTLGYDRRAMAQLLPYAEAGFLEALAELKDKEPE